jgi:hypothetical protein
VSLLELIKEIKSYREICPGEFAGPCPTCGGVLRLRIWPDQDRFKCSHCLIEGQIEDFARILASCAPAATSEIPAKTETAPSKLLTNFICQITAPDGRDYFVTDKQAEWQRLSAAGETVFSASEILRIGQMMDMAGERAAKVAELHMEAKRTFSGIYVSEVKICD